MQFLAFMVTKDFRSFECFYAIKLMTMSDVSQESALWKTFSNLKSIFPGESC